MRPLKRVKSPAILEVIGYSGAGKTTLIEKLIPALRKRGLRLAVIKLRKLSLQATHCKKTDKEILCAP